MGEILGAIILALASGISLAALLTTLSYLLPDKVQQIQAIVESSPRRAFVIGLVNFIFFGLLVAFGAERGPFLRFMAALIALALSGLSTAGLTAVMHLLRQRVYNSQTVSDTLKTAVLLIAAGLTPFIGWFVLAPIILLIGLGAAILVMVGGRQPKPDITDDDQLPY